MNSIKIPAERVGVLIGRNGQTKRMIEKKTNTNLIVDKEGDVVINGEGVDVYNANIVIKAIGRGFNPSIASSLLKDENCLEIINLKDFSGGSKKKFFRIKSRVIGSEGKFRKTLEYLTNTNMVVFCKTVSIIGEVNDVNVAKRGTEILLRGAPHSNAYRYIEREISKARE